MRYPEIAQLIDAGFKVVQKEPWHFEVIGKKTLVNVWPTKRKWMIQYGSGASYYSGAEELLEIVTNIIGEKKLRNPRWLIDSIIAEHDAHVTQEMRDCYLLWKRGMEKFSTDVEKQLA